MIGDFASDHHVNPIVVGYVVRLWGKKVKKFLCSFLLVLSCEPFELVDP
jgi:hypothetical protein